MICAEKIPTQRAAGRSETMSNTLGFTRRQFVSTAISAATISCLPTGREFFAALAALERGAREFAQQSQVALTTSPPWRDQAVLSLTKSPYAKLRNVPVHAVTIENGFWAHRQLYFRYSGALRESKPVSLTFIPYYAWANRTATLMQVWTLLSQSTIG
jgi:hypothetical protein